MSIRKQEDDLFNDWQNDGSNRTGFAPDGVVSENDYRNSDPKIVFILKEVNDEGGDGWDLRNYLKEGAPGGASTWNNIARWTHAVRNRHALPDWKFYENVTEDFRKEALKDICAINLKKKPGGSSADELLWHAAQADSDFIKRQYALYDPGITFCCGKDLESLFMDVVDHRDKEKDWKLTSRGVWWYAREEGKYVIAVNHPQQYSVRDSLLFYELIDAVNEIYR